MNENEVEEFMKIIVQYVRDSAIRNCDNNFDPSIKNPIAERWRSSQKNDSSENFLAMVIADTVDQTISHFLDAINQEMFDVYFKASNGKEINIYIDGDDQLPGMFLAESRSKYSNKRVYNFLDPE